MGPWLIKALNVLLLGASCYLVADVVTEIAGEALEPSPLSTGQVRAETGDDGDRVSPVTILDRNLFGAQLQGDTLVAGDLEFDPDAKLEKTKLPLRLLGTAAASNEARSRAAIQDEKNRKHLVVAVGDLLVGHKRVRVRRIERTRVILDNAGKREVLALHEDDDRPQPRARTKRTPRQARRKPANRETLNDRLAKLNGNDGQGISRILSSARIVPHYAKDGTMQGMKVDAIKQDSLLEKVGLVNGDIITEVNGIVVDRLEATSAIFQELSTAEEINLAATRGDEPLFFNANTADMMEQ